MFTKANNAHEKRVGLPKTIRKQCLRQAEEGLTSMVQGPHPSGRVVSVRMPEEIIERLDTLCARTGRSRGFYLKMAVTAMLPQLEEYHWEHV
ncbi:ribbon-helix-helix protein, CopG family, partial [Corynebacterium sp. p3-SID1241]|uniref:ribbon-helix-helix protein, CopG family n=1 Tax=Corynebacterium sp. p3-SID1241 TaxID=2916102 RepID=UPI0037BF8292